MKNKKMDYTFSAIIWYCFQERVRFMRYPKVELAQFLQRPNRFIAACKLLETNETVIAHVKNTGRGKEVFLPNAMVALSYQAAPTRKTDYDLIAIKKGQQWINIDSQVPNTLASEAIQSGQIILPGLKGTIVTLKREQRYGQSKFDIYLETDLGERVFVEVKGMTLENLGIGAFPDAPSLRGLKHVKELTQASQAGYQCYVLFIVQFEAVSTVTIHRDMQPALAEMIALALTQGVQVLAYNCLVTPATIEINHAVPFDLYQEFVDPNVKYPLI
jgi:sugar fermentation stimulation protein A